MSKKTELLFGTPTTRGKRASEGIPAFDGKNYAGGGTYNRGLEEQCLQVLCTGVFENTFYASQKTLVANAVGLFQQMAIQDSDLFARMIVYARNKGFMRIAPITALVVLSTADLTNFALAFPLVIRTPGDLQDFMAIVKSKSLRKGFGRAVKTAVGEWLNNLSEYHAIKYGSQGSDFSLRDILRLAHPCPTDETHGALFNYLCNGLTEKNGAAVARLLPQIVCVELLKEEKELKAQKALIVKGRLPYEVVVGSIKPNKQLWSELMKQMPYFALLRHLNTLHKAGVFESAENVDYVVKKLTDEKNIRGSKVFPFRFYSAYTMLDQTMPRKISEAVVSALEISFQNTPVLPGRTAVGCDVSGSMSWGTVSEKSKIKFIDIAALFSAALLKTTEDAVILPFDTSVKNLRLSARDSVMTTATTLASVGGGGTDVGSPIDHLLKNRIVVDTFIGVTDSEDWAGRGFLPAWRQYKKNVNPNAKAFLLHVAPYTHAVAPKSEPDCWFFYGWSDNILPFITLTASGGATQLDAVRATSLVSAAKVEETEDNG